MGSLPTLHFAIFPFLSQGHIIPLLHLSRLLRLRSAAVTIFTTAANSPPICAALADTDVSVVELPFPQHIQGLPPGVENTQNLPSNSFFIPFAKSTKLMQKSFEKALQTLNPPVSCIISDAFLGFTLHSAHKFNVPRLVFFGVGAFPSTMYQVLGREKPHAAAASLDEPFPIPGFPGLELTMNDFEPPYNEVAPSGPYVEFMEEQLASMAASHGMIVNTFYEMERRYVDYWDSKIGPKIYCAGPLCAVAPPRTAEEKLYVRFLDEKLAEGRPVLYIAFGTQAEVSPEQLREIALGLERSGVSFLWVLKSETVEFCPNFEERVRERGIVVREWVDQLEVLKHEGVCGFLSHCGWNSALEGITAGVPILALPFMAEQHLNARFLAEELGVGLRIMPTGGSVRGHVVAEEVERVVRELMCGERGAEARRKMAECGGAARGAMKEGGSSMGTLDLLIDEISGRRSRP
ncbi:UDP-glycosyltransferase 90A1-like [Salvia miltiorrhiza]|uniref:UDP-glycosyltransferase 90A1-like n=1 Tax=Salvia miltiorrhiza TaxID=226208 RepID=UPI0025AD2FED|nr:UDP-glycosyltransferase 90A1-like [Salvia miltiorrhiza]